MKSTTRMIGAWRGWDTRRQNELRRKALVYFTGLARTNGWYLPTIIAHLKDDWGHGDCCVELCIDWGGGYLSRWFKTRADASDYLIDIAPKCC